MRVLVLAVLAGCSDFGFSPTVDVDDASPHVDVFPAELAFGVRRTDQVHRDVFTIRNKGNANLTIEGLDLTAFDFELSGVADGSRVVEPGASVDVEVAYAPKPGAEAYGVVVVRSDDPLAPEVPVYLTGVAAVPDLYIEPTLHDFGEVGVTCPIEEPLRLINQGGDPLVIESVTQLGEAFGVTLPELPVTIEPGEWIEGALVFTPEEAEDWAGRLEVVSNDPDGLGVAGQVGVGVPIATRSEEFLVPSDPPVDILFAIDQSCSMADDAEALADNFTAFIELITTVTSAWSVAVVTNDDGCFDTWIDERTPNYEAEFAYAVKIRTGPGAWEPMGEGADTERLLTVARNALVDGAKDCNAGFVRENVTTHVVLVSDEREQSAETPDALVSQMQSVAPRLVVSAVAGDMPAGCETADPGTGYDEAVALTGGAFLSICGAWGSHVEDLAAVSLDNAYRFGLVGVPVAETITVTVEGAEIPSGWSYDEANNELVMAAPLPIGALVVVTYAESTDCQP